ncbi:MAG: hypothetical protein ACRDUY_06955 [Nitriliruptorales bacterium]
MRLRAHGIGADLPDAWEGAISVEQPVALGPFSTGPPPASLPVVHLATFPLPANRGDFGGSVVPLMTEHDAFVALLEYGPEHANTALFAGRGMPRRLDPRRFSPRGLHRRIHGHVGYQTFFTAAGRAFCLYVVLGSDADRHLLARRVERVLATVEIEAVT